MSARALVTVLLPCHNAERFLPAALESLLVQTYGELEILALDDGSRDATSAILDGYAARDSRVRVIAHASNQGLIATLNRGVAEAAGDYVVRMDADDVSFPNRVERQVQALAQRADIGVLGSSVLRIDERGRSLGLARVRCVEPGAARFMSIFATPLVHPTLAGRTAVMRAYPYGDGPDSLHAEDYELFTRMLAAGVQFLNLNEPLLGLRTVRASVSRRHEATQIANFVTCSRRHLVTTLGLRPEPGAHSVLVNRMTQGVTARDLRHGLDLLARVEDAFAVREPVAVREINGIADEQRLDILIQAFLIGSPQVRLAASALALRRSANLLSPRTRAHLAAKLRARLRERTSSARH